MKNITDIQFKIEVAKIKNQYQDDLKVKLPEFRIVFKKEHFPIVTKFDDNGFYIEIAKIHLSVCENYFKSLLYHEFTHLCDLQEAKKLKLPTIELNGFSEIRAGYIEAKCLFNLFSNNSIRLTNEIKYLGSIASVEEIINDKFTETFKDDIIHQIKSMQYFLGCLICLNEYCKELNKENYLKKLKDFFGPAVILLYNNLKVPLDFSIENMAMCSVYMEEILSHIKRK